MHMFLVDNARRRFFLHGENGMTSKVSQCSSYYMSVVCTVENAGGPYMVFIKDQFISFSAGCTSTEHPSFQTQESGRTLAQRYPLDGSHPASWSGWESATP